MRVDYFQDRERERQRDFADWRDKAFSPVVKMLATMAITPSMLSLLGALALIAMGIIPPAHLMPAASLFGLHLLCDALDGPLARRTGSHGPAGALVDIICDQTAIIGVAVGLCLYTYALPLLVVVLSTSYVMFIFSIVIANMLGVKIVPFIRIKYPLIVFSLLLIHVPSFAEFVQPAVNPVLAVAAGYYLIMLGVFLVVASQIADKCGGETQGQTGEKK